jgi:GT2 family glycosyltransferase
VHFDRSVTQWNDYKNTFIKTKVIAGSCMLFHKSLWTKVGGFDKSKIFFDKYFSYAVAEKGGRCLIAKGIYVFHLYRWGAIDPVSSVNHLIKKPSHS